MTANVQPVRRAQPRMSNLKPRQDALCPTCHTSSVRARVRATNSSRPIALRLPQFQLQVRHVGQVGHSQQQQGFRASNLIALSNLGVGQSGATTRAGRAVEARGSSRAVFGAGVLGRNFQPVGDGFRWLINGLRLKLAVNPHE